MGIFNFLSPKKYFGSQTFRVRDNQHISIAFNHSETKGHVKACGFKYPVKSGDFLLLRTSRGEELFRAGEVKRVKTICEWSTNIRLVQSAKCPVCNVVYELDSEKTKCSKCLVELI